MGNKSRDPRPANVTLLAGADRANDGVRLCKVMSMKFRHVARYVLCFGLYYSGVFHLFRRIRRMVKIHRMVILTYHSFSHDMCYLDMGVSPTLFIEQVKGLLHSFRVLTLSEALAICDEAPEMSGDLAVITVDDGYADNFQPLVDAVTQYGVPTTVFLTTNCIDAGEPTAVMWVMLAVHNASIKSIDLPEIGVRSLSIGTSSDKESAIRKIDAALKPLSANERAVIIERLLACTGEDSLVRQRARSTMLDWKQVRLMHAAGIEVGAHSLTHPVLSRLNDSAVRDEICGSIQRVRDMVGVETVTFAYPYGGQADVNENVVEICRRSGATAAVMLTDGDMPGGDRFRIPRMIVTSDRSTTPWGHFSRAMWACELEGLVDIFRNVVSRASVH